MKDSDTGAATLKISNQITISDNEIEMNFIRAQGAGGY